MLATDAPFQTGLEGSRPYNRRTAFPSCWWYLRLIPGYRLPCTGPDCSSERLHLCCVLADPPQLHQFYVALFPIGAGSRTSQEVALGFFKAYSK